MQRYRGEKCQLRVRASHNWIKWSSLTSLVKHFIQIAVSSSIEQRINMAARSNGIFASYIFNNSSACPQKCNWRRNSLGLSIYGRILCTINASPRNAIRSFTFQFWADYVSNLESRHRSAIWMVHRQLSGRNAASNPRSFWRSSKRFFNTMWWAWRPIKRKRMFSVDSEIY